MQSSVLGLLIVLANSHVLQIPSKEQASSVTEELRSRSALPEHLKKVLKALPEGTHPMTQLSIAIMALQVGCECSCVLA